MNPQNQLLSEQNFFGTFCVFSLTLFSTPKYPYSDSSNLSVAQLVEKLCCVLLLSACAHSKRAQVHIKLLEVI